MHKRVLALGRLKTGEMNKTEQAYWDTVLKPGLADGTLAWAKFEPMRFRLADGTFYVPDFVVMLADGQLECREVKGYFAGDGRAKLKVAAELFPFPFILVFGKARAKRDGGGWDWTTEEV